MIGLRTALAAVLGLAMLATSACAGGDTEVTLTPPEQDGIAVTGTGTATTVPDVAVLNLGVEVTRPAIGDARTAAATAMESVRASLRRNGVADRDLTTEAFNIQPQYAPFGGGGTPRITGYTVRNSVSAKVRQIDALSKTLDEAVAAGGNDIRVQDIAFTVDDPERARAEARERAVADARARADQLAKASGARLGRVRSVSESVSASERVLNAFDAKPSAAVQGAAPETPVSPGEAKIAVTVSLVYELE